MPARFSNLDLVKAVDEYIPPRERNIISPANALSFPYEDDKDAFSAAMSNLWTLVWDDGLHHIPLGLLTQATLSTLIQTPSSIKGEMEIRRSAREVLIFHQATEEERSAKVAATTKYWKENKMFRVLEGWRNELFPVYGPDDTLLYSVERTAAALFGIPTYGAHMTAYVKDETATHGVKFWIPRRSRTKMTWAGMLDNTVAGGMATGEVPLECIIREAEEEASLPDNIVRRHIKPAGTVTYIYLRAEDSTGETGLLVSEVEYVYDLELPAEVIPKPNDSEVEQFYLLSVEEVQEAMARGEFKPNCAVVLLDFFMRHGILTKENEPDYDEIKRRMHRPLPYPGPHGARAAKAI